MLTIGTEATFDAAHHIPGHPECGEVHGHSWRVEVVYKTLGSPALDKFGFLVDFGAIKDLIRQLDHPGTELNELPGLDFPSAENIAAWIWERLPRSHVACDVTVKVWESPWSHSHATWTGVRKWQ